MKQLFALLFLVPIFISAQEVLLTGAVIDPILKEGIAEAQVRIYLGSVYGEKNVQTDELGKFTVTAEVVTPDKDYPISINREGYYHLNGTVRLNYGENAERVFKLYKRKEVAKPEVLAQTVSLEGAPSNNLIFLIDVSGSMAEDDRLNDLKESLLYLVGLYRPEDQISIVTYSSDVDVVLEKGSISNLEDIQRIIDDLQPTGKTEGVAGLVRAYEMAVAHYVDGGNNKVIMATDGIFADDKKSQRLVEQQILKGLSDNVTLSILSFGDEAEAVQDRLADWSDFGRGRYAHITTLDEVKELIVAEASGR